VGQASCWPVVISLCSLVLSQLQQELSYQFIKDQGLVQDVAVSSSASTTKVPPPGTKVTAELGSSQSAFQKKVHLYYVDERVCVCVSLSTCTSVSKRKCSPPYNQFNVTTSLLLLTFCVKIMAFITTHHIPSSLKKFVLPLAIENILLMNIM